MKMKALCEAMLWLPGFEPAGWEGDVAPPEVIKPEVALSPVAMAPANDDPAAPRTSGIFRRPVAARPPKEVWPLLTASELGAVGQVGKFNANIAAIKTLKLLEAEGRKPEADERAILNRYTGWGGLSKIFAYQHEREWRERQQEFEQTLSSEEKESVRASTPNAHFTSHEVIAAMWAMVERLGFKGGKVLEPSAGAGYFIGAMPTKLAQASTVTAVELDSLSARITKSLYGGYGVKVHHQGFEKLDAPEGFYDLVISNVPFGNYPVHDPKGRWSKLSIHDYFIAKALSLTRVGGLVACITSAYTMDKHDDSARNLLSQMGDLVAAIRLPQTAFKAIAGTDVMTDILIFQRRAEGVATDRSWCEKPSYIPSEMRDEEHRDASHLESYFRCNPYLIENRGNVVGEFTMGGNGYNKCLSLVLKDGDLGKELDARVATLPQGIVPARSDATEVEVSPRSVMVASAEWIKPGAYVISDGKVAVSINGSELEIIEDSITTAKARRIRGIIPVRDAARKVLAAQATSEDDALLERYRIGLMAAYDAFVGQFGPISKPFNQSAYREDPDFPLLLSLEHWDPESGLAKKADVFYRRTVGAYRRVERCETPEEALLVCLAENARVVPSRIAELLEQEVDDAMDMLRSKGLVYVDPMTESYVEADAYLSGDVKAKLSQAEHAIGDYSENIEALKSVIPEDIPANEIGVKLGSTWIPCVDYKEFVDTLLAGANSNVTFHGEANSWQVKGTFPHIANTQTWGTSRVSAADLIAMTLNQSVPRVTDADPNDPAGKKRVVNTMETVAAREKQEGIKEEFAKWVWEDEDRKARLVRIYNDRFNRIVTREFDGSHLVLPGFSSSFTLREHQANAIWRCVASASCTLLAHVVGAGKTLTMICAAMEMRRTGMVSKPCIVVPNHMLEQFAAEFLRAYPAANVLIASKDDMSPQRRKALLARMAFGDWDAVVMTHSSFEKVEMPAAYTEAVISNEIAAMEAQWKDAKDDGNTRAVKELAKLKKTWTARLEKRALGTGKDGMLDFAEIGFDGIIVDEAHAYKNRYRHTNLQMAGLPTNDSNRAFDMSVKVSFVQEKKGNRGVIFATGTPIANSVAEMWTMQKFLQPQTLEANGLEMFDAWAANFGEPVTAMELAPDGSSYRIHTRFARFVNVPELLTMFREVADIKTADMLDLPVPKAMREIVTAEPSPELKKYVQELVLRAENIRNGHVKPDEDNMLAVTNDGRKAATDIRLCNGSDYEGSKVNLVVSNVHSIWKETAGTRGVQLVFLDMGTPSAGRRWNLYDDIRDKLEILGVPKEEVAFIHEANTDKAKEKLFEKVRSGAVRVMVGSTSKMGTGTNVQNRLVALHHVDGPWRPADVEQRDGRIVRQGNMNASVRILRYVTAGTFDAYIWQTLETKARFIAQVMRGDAGIRNMEDAEMAALSYAEVKALASGNPMVIEKAGVDAEVMRLSMLKSAWQRQNESNRFMRSAMPKRISADESLLADLVADEASAKAAAETMSFSINGKPEGNPEEAALRIIGAGFMVKPRQSIEIGRVGDFLIEVEGSLSIVNPPRLLLTGKRVHEVGEMNKTPKGILAQIRSMLTSWISEDVERVSTRLESQRAELNALKLVQEEKFAHEEALSRLLIRKAEIDALLCPAVSENAVDVGDKADVPVAMAA